MADITIANRVYKPTYNWGASSCTYVRIIVVHDPASHRSPFQDVDIGPKIRHMVALANRNGDTTVNMDGSSDQIP